MSHEHWAKKRTITLKEGKSLDAYRDDAKIGIEYGWYKIVMERNAAQHQHVRRTIALDHLLNIARSFV